jgi:hypothetical protein
MASLTETAYYARRTINWLILGIIAYFILKLVWGILLTLIFIIFPPKATPPDHRYGKLPALRFPKVASPSGNLQFRLETIEGAVPRASSSAIVYFMPKSAPNLMALTNTQRFAERLQFNTNPITESKNIYRFEDPNRPQRTLRYDIISNNFIVRYAYEQDLSVFSETNVPGTEAAKAEARSLLQTLALMPKDVEKGETIVTYLKLVNDRLEPTTSQSQANAVRVGFYRQQIGQMKMMTPIPDEASISIILSGSRDSKKRVLQLAYTYWPVDYTTKANYAIKQSTQAWQELQAGKGYIPKYPSGNVMTVRRVYLSYYDSYEPQLYLQPIFVFEGDDGIYGYVPAVAPPWTE